jgi:hypothetical protein
MWRWRSAIGWGFGGGEALGLPGTLTKQERGVSLFQLNDI